MQTCQTNSKVLGFITTRGQSRVLQYNHETKGQRGSGEQHVTKRRVKRMSVIFINSLWSTECICAKKKEKHAVHTGYNFGAVTYHLYFIGYLSLTPRESNRRRLLILNIAGNNGRFLGIHVKYPIFLHDLNQIWNFLTEVHASLQHKTLRKSA